MDEIKELKTDQQGQYLYIRSQKYIDFEIMKDNLNAIKNNHKLPRKLRILEDARGVKAQLTIEDIDLLLSLMYEIVDTYEHITHAVVHNLPRNTAFALIFANRKIHRNHNLKIFSSMAAATAWLENEE